MSALSLRASEGQLKAFRLTDVPEHIRIEAAFAHADEIHRALKDRGAKGTLRRVHGLESFGAIDRASAVMQLAMYPSDHVYRISRKAWDAMVARAEDEG